MVELKRGSEWYPLYGVEPDPSQPSDYEVANWYTSTHPDGGFVNTLTAQLATPTARHILRNRRYTIVRADTVESYEVQSPEHLLEILQSTFGLDFPPGTRFRHPDFG